MTDMATLDRTRANDPLALDVAVAPPSLEAIERLCREGPLAVRLEGDLDPAGDERLALDWIRCLRDLTACAVTVIWRAGPGFAPLAPLLHHIAPPTAIDGGDCADWRRLHRYGLLFWRSGPDFVTIVDRRLEESANHYILDTPDYRDLFRAAETLTLRDELAGIDAEALAALEADGLLLSRAGWSVALPYRMRHWPVPFTAI